jgi:hypothetical protein
MLNFHDGISIAGKSELNMYEIEGLHFVDSSNTEITALANTVVPKTSVSWA